MLLLYLISADAFINTVDICYLLQQHKLTLEEVCEMVVKSVVTALVWTLHWEPLLELLFCPCYLIFFRCSLACWWGLVCAHGFADGARPFSQLTDAMKESLTVA